MPPVTPCKQKGQRAHMITLLNRSCLQSAVCLACNHVELLLASEVDELHCIATYADSKVLVFLLFGVFHCVFQLVNAENINVQVVCPLVEIAVHHANQCA